MEKSDVETGDPAQPVRKGWLASIGREIRHHPFAYGTVAAFAVLGPIFTRMIFPEAPPLLGLFGGLVLGGFFAFCAVPDKLFE